MPLDRFSASEDERLIELVSRHRLLWNVADPEWKNLMRKDIIWTEIGRNMKKTSALCKMRWKSIRDHYKKQKKHDKAATTKKRAAYWDRMGFLEMAEDSQQSSSNSTMLNEEERVPDMTDSRLNSTEVELGDEIVTDEIMKKKWRYFKDRRWTDDGKASTSKSGSNSDQQGPSWPGIEKIPFVKVEVLNSADLSTKHFSEIDETESILSNPQDPLDDGTHAQDISMPSTSLERRLCVDTLPRNFMELEYKKSLMMDKQVGEREDEDFFYLMSILPTMKRLSTIEKLRLRTKIDHLLLEAISNNGNSYTNDCSENNNASPAQDRKRKRTDA